MKKVSLFIMLMLSAILMSGCTQNYETVNEYRHALDMKMKHPSYIIDVKQNKNGKETYYRTYIMDEKWRTDKLSDDGNSYEETYIYDGIDSLIHKAKSDFALLNYGVESMDKNDKNRILKINQTNPTDRLIHWGNEYNLFQGMSTSNPVFINQNDKKNGFKCRLIKVNENKEVCVSDKYGIAVYEKSTEKGNGNTVITDVIGINIRYTPITTFQLPEGIKRKEYTTLPHRY